MYAFHLLQFAPINMARANIHVSPAANCHEKNFPHFKQVGEHEASQRLGLYT